MIPTAAIERINDQVPALSGRVKNAADLAKLIAEKIIPQVTPAAWVLWQGDDAQPNTYQTAIVQHVTEGFSVVLVHKVAGDTTGEKAQAAIDAIRLAVRNCLVGWQPAGAEYPVEYTRGRLIGIKEGALFLQLDFSTAWHLRQG